jgi:hypothetical protein
VAHDGRGYVLTESWIFEGSGERTGMTELISGFRFK